MNKQCSKCKQSKPLSDFPSNGKDKATGQTRYRSACKVCEKVRDKARYVPKNSRDPKPAHDMVIERNRLAAEFARWERSQNPFEGFYVIDPVSSCWNWSGALCPAGYGIRVRKASDTSMAHRAIMEHLDYDLSGMHVHHDCRNRKCINPAHLMVLTPDEHTELHAKELRSGHDNGPSTPKNTHRATLTAKQLVIEYLEALPKEVLAIPAARPNQYQAKTAKALRVSTISFKSDVSGYLVDKLLKEIPLYDQLVNSTYIEV
ncbi:HNH endonuclease [Pantoea ananatis]|uniref:HNH endonuclease n=1 Tax=Pantoea ananas TaxID=553 RepID=UPI0011A04786|nr:HNH endonuclease [Pantoea ananatis]